MADKEKLGYHKGALKSLLNERAELARLLQIVNSLIEKHSKALDKMGVDVEKFIENLQEEQKQRVERSKRETKEEGGKEGRYDLSKEELPE